MKYYLKIGAVLALLAFLAWYRQSVFNDGIEHCQNEYREATVAKYAEIQADYQRDMKKALKLQSDEFKVALETARSQKEVITKTNEVIKYVDREIKVPVGCDDLANSVISVFKQATDIIPRN